MKQVLYNKKHVKKYCAQGAAYYYALYCYLRNTRTGNHFHKQDKPSWYKKSQDMFYREITKLCQLGLAEKIKSKVGDKRRTTFRLVKLRHGLKADKKGNYYFDKIEIESPEELQRCFERLSVILNLRAQEFKIVLRKLKIKGKAQITKTVSKAIRCEQKKLRSGDRANYKSPNSTLMSCEGAGKICGMSKWYGFILLREMLNLKMVNRKIVEVPVSLEMNYKIAKERFAYIKQEGLPH